MFNSFANEKYKNTKCGTLEAKGADCSNQIPKFNQDQKFIIISGPTGVGKSDFAEYLANNLGYDGVIINGDMGQLYTPISIGTAKPENIDNCYLFNVMDEPLDLGSYEFRNIVLSALNECWSSGKLPIIVGGSGFYLKSLFYPPTSFNADEIDDSEIIENFKHLSTQELYLNLENIDPKRAQSIHPNDRYRIERALFLWEKTSLKPSELKPKFEPLGSCFFYFVKRDKKELVNRINERVGKMLVSGWIDEVKNLNDPWKKFLLKKKLIGYPEIIRYLEEGSSNQENLAKIIGFKTAQYAKSQMTFWRSLQKQLIESDPNKYFLKDIQEFDLTNNFECLKDIIVKKLNES
jgi:tRNA dimethylallyltransferase